MEFKPLVQTPDPLSINLGGPKREELNTMTQEAKVMEDDFDQDEDMLDHSALEPELELQEQNDTEVVLVKGEPCTFSDCSSTSTANDYSMSPDSKFSNDEKNYVIDEEIMQYIMSSFGIEYLLWDNQEEDMSSLQGPEERQSKMNDLQFNIWNESHSSRKTRVEMAKAKLSMGGHDITEMCNKIRCRVSARLRRMSESEDKRLRRLERDKIKSRMRRATESEEQGQQRRELNRNTKRLRRAMETPEEREARLAKSREGVRRRRALQRQLLGITMTREQSEKARQRRQKRLEAETPEEREARLSKHRERIRLRRLNQKLELENAMATCSNMDLVKEELAKKRAEAQKRKERRELQRLKETPEQRQERLERQRIRKKESRERTKLMSTTWGSGPDMASVGSDSRSQDHFTDLSSNESFASSMMTNEDVYSLQQGSTRIATDNGFAANPNSKPQEYIVGEDNHLQILP